MRLGKFAFYAGVFGVCLAEAACSSSNSPTGYGAGGGGSSTGGSSTGGSSTGGSSTGGSSTGGGGATSTGGATTGGGGATGGAGGSTETPDAATPTIKITDPEANEAVGPSADYPDFPDAPVAFTVTHFTLKDPGSSNCPAGTCGHVHLYVNAPGQPKTECNDVGSHLPYNNAGSSSPINAGLDYCPTTPGPRVITLELHNNDHTPVKGADGNVISDSIDVTVAGSEAGVAGDGGP